MATFRLTHPSGAEYEVDAPDEHAAVAALTKLNGASRGQPVTDPALLAQLNAAEPAAAMVRSENPFAKYAKEPVSDPALLAQLNGSSGPIRIGAPDGSTVEFPAGTSDDTIKSAMGKAYPSENPFAKYAKEPSAKKEDGSYMKAVDNVVRALANGMTFGLADRFAAAASSATGVGAQPHSVTELVTGQGAGNDYAANLERERKRTDEFATEHPYVSGGANLVGGVALPLGALGAAAKGVSLGAKTLLGAGAGAGFGAVQGAAGSKDWTDLPQTAKDAAFGAGTGALIGGAIPGTSAAVGAAYGKVMNAMRGRVEGMSRGASSHVIKGVEADGPAAVRARLDELGPDAMLGDAGPALLGKLQGAALNSDEGRSVAMNALTTRDKGTNARIQSDVNRVLGPAEDPQLASANIRRIREEKDAVAYPAALDNAPAVKIAPIMTELQDRIAQTPAGGMEHKALTKLQEMLTRKEKQRLLDAEGYPQYDKLGNERWKDVPLSHDDANVLHKVKQELDNVIQYDAPGLGVPAGALSRQQGALKQMRFAINDALEKQVPGYAEANSQSAALAKRMDAVQAGTQYLGAGKTTPSPERFAMEFDPLSHGEKIALAKGSRGEVERILGTQANDLVGLKRELQGEGGWNTAKLGTVHGQDAADELARSVDRNTVFRDTHTKVVGGSQTDLRNAARKEMKPDPSTDTPLINPNSTMAGMAGTVAKKGVQSIINALTRSDPTRHYGEVARALTEQGAGRDARLLAIVDAIERRKGNAATAGRVGDASALLSAIAANGYVLDAGRKRKPQ